jgi:cob(I)alamin adenosyltransferase
LVGGKRVAKDSLRVNAYGCVDEVNSVLGIARSHLKDKELDALLAELQADLFVVGADLASVAGNEQRNLPHISGEKVTGLERVIDQYEAELSPLKSFILPGGGTAGAILHNARTVARRAERSIVTLSKAEKINDQMLPYMNRLSDLLFVLARLANHREHKGDVEWHPKQ